MCTCVELAIEGSISDGRKGDAERGLHRHGLPETPGGDRADMVLPDMYEKDRAVIATALNGGRS